MRIEDLVARCVNDKQFAEALVRLYLALDGLDNGIKPVVNTDGNGSIYRLRPGQFKKFWKLVKPALDDLRPGLGDCEGKNEAK